MVGRNKALGQGTRWQRNNPVTMNAKQHYAQHDLVPVDAASRIGEYRMHLNCDIYRYSNRSATKVRQLGTRQYCLFNAVIYKWRPGAFTKFTAKFFNCDIKKRDIECVC